MSFHDKSSQRNRKRRKLTENNKGNTGLAFPASDAAVAAALGTTP